MHARSAFAQTITEAADSFDGVAGFAQLLPQAADVSIDGASINHAFVTPDVAEEAVPLLHPAAPLHQGTQQFVLETGEMNYFTIDGDMMTQAIDPNGAGNERLHVVWSFAPAQNRLRAQDDFPWRKRF